MSKKITVIIPDDYHADNAVERIKADFGYNPNVQVLLGRDINGWLGEVIHAVGDLQTKLNMLDKEKP